MQLAQQVRDQVRNLLNIRTARQVTPIRSKPKPDFAIFRGEVRMVVQAGLSDELWEWLTTQGWREPVVWPDRRRYRDVPASLVRRLFDARPEDRMKVLALAVSRATAKPSIHRSPVLPHTIPSSVIRK